MTGTINQRILVTVKAYPTLSLLQNATVYDRLDELIAGAKSNTVSLAVFKPAIVIDFIWEDDDREWSQQRLEQMRALHSQLALFEDNS